MRRLLVPLILIMVLPVFLASCQKPISTNEKTTDSAVIPAGKEKVLEKPTMQIDINKVYTAQMKTSEGDITIELNAADAPNTVNNFVYLAKNKFYDGTVFHRAIKGFMIQGGDPNGDGTGGPGYTFADEPFTGEYTRGTIAMANAGPNTNGSQFFIMHADYGLPKNYIIFGHVTAGLDVVDKIATAPVTMSAQGENSKPLAPVKVESVTISEK
jgi:cyclophilin family peptidyl-prolyl cis-trans isomerase